ncbi:hypothetical protein [Siphonobacter sp. SORGH_AS_1065]|uniref:hypothetical protein n=1 Tax=Siphonobacter sp. SORGH_AS_1065 TaxID=3041795 RepID=UPI0027800780|nr:hypothetical protein [Siphonobacter sp. SORGH_AS_1065]MDQ1089015.1 hypothetical protein [Siphonobacter sp. SORGH_AS_1065]
MKEATTVIVKKANAFPCRECERAYNLAVIHQNKKQLTTASDFYNQFYETFCLDVRRPKRGSMNFGWIRYPIRLGLWVEENGVKTVFAEINQVEVRDFGIIAEPF